MADKESEKTVIPVNWNDSEFQTKFIQAFNVLEGRVSHLEQVAQNAIKEMATLTANYKKVRIEQLEKELQTLRN